VPLELISFLTYPSLFCSRFDPGGQRRFESRRGTRIGDCFWDPLVFLAGPWRVGIDALEGSYKGAIPSFTSSLSEVGPEIKDQLISISGRPRRGVLLRLLAGLLLIVLALFRARTIFGGERAIRLVGWTTLCDG